MALQEPLVCAHRLPGATRAKVDACSPLADHLAGMATVPLGDQADRIEDLGLDLPDRLGIFPAFRDSTSHIQ